MQQQDNQKNLNTDGIKSLFKNLILSTAQVKDNMSFKEAVQNEEFIEIITELMIVGGNIKVYQFVIDNFGNNNNLINKI